LEVEIGMSYTDLTGVITMHNQVVANSNFQYEVGKYRTLTIEVYGTSASRTVNFSSIGYSGAVYPLTGVRLSDLSVATSTTGTGEIWTFEVAGLDFIKIDVVSIAGGNVSVKGRFVA
jgi:hypothetical protein